MEGWEIVETGFVPAHARAWEGLFTLGSGYLHTRGSLEEHLDQAPQNRTYTRSPANVTSERFADAKAKWGTYVPGVFGRHPLLNNEMINLPWFLGMAPIVDGERLDLEQSDIEEYRRVLHMDTATLTRTLRWRTRSGKHVEVCFERFISAANPHLAVQRVRLTADAPATLVFEAGIDADVRTNGYDHFTRVELGDSQSERRLTCTVTTDAGDTVTTETHVIGPPDTLWQVQRSDRAALLVGQQQLVANQSVDYLKLTTVTTNRDRTPPPSRPASAARAFEESHQEHARIWKERWAGCDVLIEGDPDSQHAMRVALFHLLRAHVTNDARVAIDAKGYAGEAYWGRYFWDTEMFLLPFFLYTDPDRARTLVDFRVQSLPGAQENARRYGYPGARYGWESDAAGIDCCPNWQYADHEVHVTADVAYGLEHFARATDNPGYLRGPAARVLLETARYWMARVDQRPGDSFVSLLGVMGPDEYTPISSNNSFTNVLVSEALRAAAVSAVHAGASAQECSSFRNVADRLGHIQREDGLVLQCEEFERFAEPDFQTLWPDRMRPFAAQVSQERLYRTKALKQADVLMLMMLFPQHYSDSQVRQAWDYYVPYTTHDSSLSPGAHAIIATRLGLPDQAWEFWLKSRALDLDVEHGGAAEGIHIANAGAVWQMAVFGFAGMRTAMQADTLTFTPGLPKQWARLGFPLIWKSTPLHIDIDHQRVRISNRGDKVIRVCVGTQEQSIDPKSDFEWKYPS